MTYLPLLTLSCLFLANASVNNDQTAALRERLTGIFRHLAVRPNDAIRFRTSQTTYVGTSSETIELEDLPEDMSATYFCTRKWDCYVTLHRYSCFQIMSNKRGEPISPSSPASGASREIWNGYQAWKLIGLEANGSLRATIAAAPNRISVRNFPIADVLGISFAARPLWTNWADFVLDNLDAFVTQALADGTTKWTLDKGPGNHPSKLELFTRQTDSGIVVESLYYSSIPFNRECRYVFADYSPVWGLPLKVKVSSIDARNGGYLWNVHVFDVEPVEADLDVHEDPFHPTLPLYTAVHDQRLDISYVIGEHWLNTSEGRVSLRVPIAATGFDELLESMETAELTPSDSLGDEEQPPASKQHSNHLNANYLLLAGIGFIIASVWLTRSNERRLGQSRAVNSKEQK